MQNFINRIDSAKPIFNQAINDLIQETIANSPNNETKQVIGLAQNIVNSILKGSYRYQNGSERIDFGNGYSTLINFASSGLCGKIIAQHQNAKWQRGGAITATCIISLFNEIEISQSLNLNDPLLGHPAPSHSVDCSRSV